MIRGLEILLVVSYDISDDKIRTEFSKFLKKFEYRMQYSVYKIKNSDRILSLILNEIEKNYVTLFTENDSIVIFELSGTCKERSYGYARHEEEDFMLVS